MVPRGMLSIFTGVLTKGFKLLGKPLPRVQINETITLAKENNDIITVICNVFRRCQAVTPVVYMGARQHPN